MGKIISLEGPVELWNGELALRIPLSAGGEGLISSALGVGESDGTYLNIIIQPWLAKMLKLAAGSIVIVDNRNGKLNISRSPTNGSSSR